MWQAKQDQRASGAVSGRPVASIRMYITQGETGNIRPEQLSRRGGSKARVWQDYAPFMFRIRFCPITASPIRPMSQLHSQHSQKGFPSGTSKQSESMCEQEKEQSHCTIHPALRQQADPLTETPLMCYRERVWERKRKRKAVLPAVNTKRH